jgi:hypothetical protein
MQIDFADLALAGTDRWKLAGSDATFLSPTRRTYSLARSMRRSRLRTRRAFIRCSNLWRPMRAPRPAPPRTDIGARGRSCSTIRRPASRRRQCAEVKRLLSLRAYGDRLGVGARAERSLARPERSDPRPRPRVRRKPARVQRSLGQRRDRRALHGGGDGRAVARRAGVCRRSRGCQSRIGGGASQGLPPQSDCKFEAAALAETPPPGP